MKIFLIGMMGSGKSFWCEKLAKKLNAEAYDLDYVIESAEQKTIAQVFADSGEAYFRKIEAEHLRSFENKQHCILATGGGTPCFHENMQWMNASGITVWIDEPVEVLVERAMKQVEHRPAIKGLSAEEVYRLFSKRLEERKSFYSQAAYHLYGADINEHNFAKIIQQHA